MAEDITFQFPQLFPEVMDANTYTATIDAIDYDNDKADVTIAEIGSFENVEIFYHCQHCSNTTGGSEAFNVGDSVRVLNPKGSCTPSVTDPFSKMRIVGFSDGSVNLCVLTFILSITRADGEIIDNSKYASYCTISFYDADMVEQTGVTRTYDEILQEHTFKFLPTILGVGGAATEFYIKGVYTDDSTSFLWFPDKYQSVYAINPPVSCLRTPGDYSFTFPYWRNVISSGGSIQDRGESSIYSLTTYSSIPYKVYHKATAPADHVSHIIYAGARVVTSLVNGERCCQLPRSTFIADVNGIDPVVRQPGAEGYAHGGFAHSYIVLDIISDFLSYTEGYQRIEALDLEEIEDCEIDIGGVTRNIQMTNNTPADADLRLWECSDECPPLGQTVWINYLYATSKISIQLVPDYDFE